jgi:hypothetical protein
LIENPFPRQSVEMDDLEVVFVGKFDDDNQVHDV